MDQYINNMISDLIGKEKYRKAAEIMSLTVALDYGYGINTSLKWFGFEGDIDICLDSNRSVSQKYRLEDLQMFFSQLYKDIRKGKISKKVKKTCDHINYFTVMPENFDSMEPGFEIFTGETESGCDGYDGNRTCTINIPGLLVYSFCVMMSNELKKILFDYDEYDENIIPDDVRNFSDDSSLEISSDGDVSFEKPAKYSIFYAEEDPLK